MIAEPSEFAPVDVVVGVVAHRQGAYVLDKFLSNQKDIQDTYPGSRLVIATREPDFLQELRNALDRWGLNGGPLYYETVKPAYARSRVWNVACGREAIRQDVLHDISTKDLIFLDLDMTYDPNVILIMQTEVQGHDIVFSGYALRELGIALAGGGCFMIRTDILKRIQFRCIEFKNGAVITEDALLELDLMRLGARIKKGFFMTINHYFDSQCAKSVSRQPIGLYRRITHSSLARRALITLSIGLRHDIGDDLNSIIYKIHRSRRTAQLGGK